MAGWTAVSGCDGWQADGRIIAQRRDGFQAHVACALHGPLIILFEQQSSDEADDGSLVGEDADHIARTSASALSISAASLETRGRN